jgi:hypothetical protein
VRVFARVVFHRFGCAPVGISLAQDGIHGAAFDFVVAGLGVLLDHLVDDSKESRIAAGIDHPDVLVTGHPYVDIWAAVKPSVVGIAEWPDIPKSQPWKEGICAALGVDDPRLFWKKILNSVSSYADLQPPLVGAVEQLIDFVTEPS